MVSRMVEVRGTFRAPDSAWIRSHSGRASAARPRCVVQEGVVVEGEQEQVGVVQLLGLGQDVVEGGDVAVIRRLQTVEQREDHRVVDPQVGRRIGGQ